VAIGAGYKSLLLHDNIVDMPTRLGRRAIVKTSINLN